ncbi:MAG: zinc ribbon domain-containing protein, partial [Thermoleophilia bacterium]|nr:zinc ribbon domain-containing protein [Thermoleophilia bacterium]
MGLLDSIGIGKQRTPAAPAAGAPSRAQPGGVSPASRGGSAPNRAGGSTPAAAPSSVRKRGKRGGSPSARERVASAAAPLHERRRRLVAARESTLRDLGGLMLEMYKRNRFREELLLDKCEEVLAIEVEVAHVDQRLFQLAPPNAAGMRPIGRCECGASIHPGQNFCGVCGRSFTTLTQARACTTCGSGLRAGDQFCGTCGHEAPDMLQSIEAPGPGASGSIDASALAASAVAETVIIDAPPLDE